MSDDSSDQERKAAAIERRKGRRSKSCIVMPEKGTLRGKGCMMSEMRGAEDVFGLENRYSAYAADRRKVLSKKEAAALSHSEHKPRESTLMFAGEDLMKRKSLEHGSFFEYRNKQQQPSSGRRKAPLRARSLDLADATVLARAMTAIRRNDDSSSSGKSFNDSSSDSSFTASLCSYSKEMAAKTNVFDRSKKKQNAEDSTKEILTMQIDVGNNESADADTDSDLDSDKQPPPAPRRKVPSRSKSVDQLDMKTKPEKMATANVAVTSKDKKKGKSKEMDESKRSKDKKASSKKNKEGSSKTDKKECSSKTKEKATKTKESKSKTKSKGKESNAKE